MERNIWSKSGENPLKSRVYAVFSVEKTVENVKDLCHFFTTGWVKVGNFPPFSTVKRENCCGKVDDSVENPEIGEKSTVFLPKPEKVLKTYDIFSILCVFLL